ncbi:hypothetical protein [Paenibacillus sp. YN15]|uniref:hypothetical protein n=1 Tax=Paenibacillus sp. YN15 TaxID=1742774 RepID=UPI000DCCA247|nr:hypothetical protein [Paenibacillus sp. YN15]RAU95333.1 hypothetical protein DQG13_22510 [Paenibacillus sp. YN15]
MQEQGQITLRDMVHHLLQVEDETWGRYAFSRELLKKRIQPGQQTEMIANAIACGRAYARRMIREHGTRDASELAGKLKLKVEFREVSMTGKRVLFASYAPPDQIIIMKEPVEQAVRLIAEEDPGIVELFTQTGIINTILGHEMFHFVEEQLEQEIYTRTEKICLWNFLGWKNYSTIRTLSEIGAMAFTQELNGLEYSPFILDVLLYYGYDAASAQKIFRDVLEVSSGRCRETEDYE